MSGLFSTLNISKGAMFTQQQSINITSHNIANAATPGYSRQQGVIQTGRPQSVVSGGQIGTGVVMTEITRTRNHFLDYQIRKESTHKGNYGVREQYLTEIESIFNEPSDTGLSKLASEFYDSWQTLSTNAEKSDARTIVAQKSKTLADELNHTFTKLNAIKGNSKAEIQQSLFDINNIFDGLNSINKEIINVTVSGNNPNDLMDRRDLLLDELSTKFGISTKNSSHNSLILKPEGSNIDIINSESGLSTNKLAFVNEINKIEEGKYEIVYYKNGDMTSDNNKRTLIVSATEEQLQSIKDSRAIWTDVNGDIPSQIGNEEIMINKENGKPSIGFGDFEKLQFTPASGSLGGIVSVYKDVDDYMGQLNSLSKAIAYSVNAVHMEGYGENSIAFFVGADNPLDYENITAENIKVNGEILKDTMKIQTGESKVSGSTDGSRALAIAQLRDLSLNIQNITNSTTYDEFKSSLASEQFKFGQGIPERKGSPSGMTVEAFYKNSINKLGIQSQEAQRIVKNQELLLEGLITRKTSISGVSMDEEMVNLVQFQHAYQANAKMISTVDELLDVVINGLKR